MPFIGSVSGSKSGRIFSLGGKPGVISSFTLTAGDANDTFSWSAPQSNGLPITKYGYQTSTDNGSSWNTEVEVFTTSAVLSTQYSTSSFKIRARAYNSAGWGDYSDISTNGTAVWSFGSMTDSGTCASFGCSCGACDCGTNTGTNSTATGTRTCYRWTRAGSTSGPLRNSSDTGACSEPYSNCTGGTCTSCSGCTSWTATDTFSCVYATGINGALTGYYAKNVLGFGWIYYSDSGCNNASYCNDGLQGTSNLEYCPANGSYRANGYDCLTVGCC